MFDDLTPMEERPKKRGGLLTWHRYALVITVGSLFAGFVFIAMELLNDDPRLGITTYRVEEHEFQIHSAKFGDGFQEVSAGGSRGILITGDLQEFLTEPGIQVASFSDDLPPFTIVRVMILNSENTWSDELAIPERYIERFVPANEVAPVGLTFIGRAMPTVSYLGRESLVYAIEDSDQFGAGSGRSWVVCDYQVGPSGRCSYRFKYHEITATIAFPDSDLPYWETYADLLNQLISTWASN